MMGEQKVMQEKLFYGFSVERHVPADHLLSPSIASSTSPAIANIWPRSTVRSAAPRSIPNC